MKPKTANFDSRALRSAFGTFMTGVTVVTTLDEQGQPVGFTANSYTSVSLDPPLLLVCPAKSMNLYEVFNNCGHFAVNILAESQQTVSNTFATATDDRFQNLAWQPDAAGCPLLPDVAASFSCLVHNRVDAGDHMILIGEVQDFQVSGAMGLGYGNNGYFSLGLERAAQQSPNKERPVRVGAIIEHDGQLLLEETEDGLRPPQVTVPAGSSALQTLKSYLANAGVAVDLGPVYSIFESQRYAGAFTYYRAYSSDHNGQDIGQYYPVAELTGKKFVSDAHTIMMQRYLLERENGIFGLYVGDDDEGDVHIFESGGENA
ncbi:MAG: flavin reductase family protein [Thiolinea sp.]